MKCLIIDDEEMAVKVIENHLSHVSGLEVAGICYNAMDAFSKLQTEKIDLLFLDIQMPKMSGLSMLKSLPSQPHVIITTAHREFAMEGYELDVVDYLLKPISFDRFLKAVGKVFKLEKTEIIKMPTATTTIRPQEPAFFYVKCDRQFVKILLEDVLYIESLRNHVKIFTTKETYIPLIGISQIEEKLPPQHFLRIHRSYIVSLSKINHFTQTHVAINDKIFPIGNHYNKDVFRRLGKDLI